MKSRIEFEVELDGQLDKKWGDYFDVISMGYLRGNTILREGFEDQSALIAFLTKLHGMGLIIRSFKRIAATK